VRDLNLRGEEDSPGVSLAFSNLDDAYHRLPGSIRHQRNGLLFPDEEEGKHARKEDKASKSDFGGSSHFMIQSSVGHVARKVQVKPFERVKRQGELKHPDRLTVLTLYALCQILNASAWVCFAPIVDKVIFGFASEKIGTFQLNYLSWVPNVMFLPINGIAMWAIEQKGLRFSLTVGMSLLCLGFMIRCLLNDSFTMCLVGQTIAVMGSPFITNMPSKLSAVWFPKSERLFATMVGVNASLLGAAVGFLLPYLIVT
jgi:hypothetical protein